MDSVETQTSTVDLVDRARELATAAHEGQVDKADAAYIGHPARVAARLPDDPLACAAAWLHDVVEDCDVTLDDLRAQGFPEPVVLAVDALTRRDGEEPGTYYRRVAADNLALKVKYADLADNSDPERLAALDQPTRERLIAKYAAARDALARFSSGHDD
jgi:(p)ppGpp synthase/HD superfamily hydrolase